jgi:hypothetical protein
MEVLAKMEKIFLLGFIASSRQAKIENGNGAFEERRKDAEILRTASVDVGGVASAETRRNRRRLGIRGFRSRPVGVLFPMKNGSI